MNANEPFSEEELDSALDEVLQLAADARASWLDAHCGNPDLRAAVRAILDASEKSGLVDRVRARLHDDEMLPNGGRIGEYRLLRKVGAGGMATVFLAERQLGELVQRVALKLMRTGLYDRTQQALFRREQRILGNLEHPGIARLVDAGLTAADVPYLVMEYVDGIPLDRYCNQAGLALRARLLLFVDVCEAVAYAHRNLIVHRDLKPSNILVTSEGMLKLLDFGIAKMLDDPIDPTRTEQRLLTPTYAAPEQVAGGAITTAVDVYSLGVILHELLTGVRPLRRNDGTTVRPSGAGADLQRDASMRNTTQRWRRQLRGDLDSIVLRALQLEPERRYANAQELAADIQRHLAGLPVRARPESWSYRAWSFLKRNRVASAAAAIVAAVLVVAALVSTQQARVATVQAQRAATAAASALRTKDFLVGMFEEIDPYEEKGGRQLTVAELLGITASKAETSLADMPDALAEVIVSAARTQLRFGEADAARTLIERTIAQFEQRRVGGVGMAHLLSARAQLLLQQGDAAAAESTANAAVGLYEEAGTANTSKIFGASYPRETLVTLQRQRGHFDAALELQQRVVADVRARHGDSVRLALALLNLADGNVDTGHLGEAERVLKEALAMAERWRGPEHMLPMQMRPTLARIWMRLGHFDEAEGELTRSLPIARRVFGENTSEVAEILRLQGELYLMSNRLAEAKESYSAAATVLRSPEATRALGSDQAQRLVLIDEALGHVAYKSGDFKAAQALYETALREREALYGPADHRVAADHASIGSMMARQGNTQAGLAEIRKGIAILESHPGASPNSLAGAYGALARILEETNDPSALEAARKAYEARLKVVGPDHPDARKALERVQRLEKLPAQVPAGGR
jgi:serine/threonine-protein kinase